MGLSVIRILVSNCKAYDTKLGFFSVFNADFFLYRKKQEGSELH